MCNAAETLLVHQRRRRVVPAARRGGTQAARRRAFVVDKAAGDAIGDPEAKRASKAHYDTEFLALKLAVRVVALAGRGHRPHRHAWHQAL